jgi:hypothetical protein
VSRLPYFDVIAFAALAVVAIVLLVASLSWTWVGETLAGAYVAFAAVRWARLRRRRTA